MFWKDKRVVVTGGAGFLGGFVVDELVKQGCHTVTVPRSSEFDLREKPAIQRLFETVRPDVVIHLAAVVGGIGANRRNPGRFFYDNAIMGVQLMEQARVMGVQKFVAIGTICAYPKHTPVPFQEENLWTGYPEETNAPYGLAKKMMLVQAQAYRDQYDYNAIYLLPVNLYGPRDCFDLENSHVIPALIRKCLDAKQAGASEILLWGDGTPTREFLYVEDAARGIVMAAEHYDGRDPVNLGSGREISIRELAEKVAKQTGFAGKIRWDTDQPNGQLRRCLDVRKAEEGFGFKATFSLDDGLAKTVEWFLAHGPQIQ